MRLAKAFGFPPMSRCQFFQANLAAPHPRPRAKARRGGRKQIPRVRWLAVSLFVSVDGWGVCGSKGTVRRLQVAQRMFLRMSIAPPLHDPGGDLRVLHLRISLWALLARATQQPRQQRGFRPQRRDRPGVPRVSYTVADFAPQSNGRRSDRPR